MDRAREMSLIGDLLFSDEDIPEVSPEISNPTHYTRWEVEPIDFIMGNDLEFWRANIIKYAMRAGFKKRNGLNDWESEIEDLEKIRRYAEIRINHIKGKEKL